MYYRTRTYIAGDWDHDKDAVDALHRWNDSSRYGLSFSDAHELKQARDTSLNRSIMPLKHLSLLLVNIQKN